MKHIISIPQGSRITYTVDGETRSGTVYKIDRGQYAERVNGRLTYPIYRIAEDTAAEITKDEVIECRTPAQLEKDVLLSLLDQDVLDNVQRSKEAVANAKERPTFKQTRRRFAACGKFSVARI